MLDTTIENGQEKKISSKLSFDTSRLPEFLQKWLEYGKHTGSPEVFRLWSGLAAASGALERRIWLMTTGRYLFPNLFALLISPPGVGKNATLDDAIELWSKVGNFNVAPKSMTAKAMVDQLSTEQACRSYVINGDWIQFQSILLAVPELGTFMSDYDNQQISILNELYDCPKKYSERTRGGGLIEIDNPHISLIAGTQPKYLARILPEHAFGMGLTSRIIMIYASEGEEIDSLFNQPGRNDSAWDKLEETISDLAEMHGEVDVSDEAKATIERRYKESFSPEPDNIKLVHYNTRRTVHILKLAMIIGALENKAPIIREEDYWVAESILLDAEFRMDDIFKEMSTTEDSDIIRETHSFISTEYFKRKVQKIDPPSVDETEVIKFLSSRVATWRIEHVIDIMLRADIISPDKQFGRNMRRFIPQEWRNV